MNFTPDFTNYNKWYNSCRTGAPVIEQPGTTSSVLKLVLPTSIDQTSPFLPGETIYAKIGRSVI
jgi:hypothetical protein